MVRSALSEKHLRRFYGLLSPPMLDFDCGTLCAPRNGDVPSCCSNENETPVLFRVEYEWQRKKGAFWRKMPIRTEEDRRFVDETMDYYVYATCPGIGSCRRSRRAVVCRVFPFEPHLDRKGTVLGLAYQDEDHDRCPLVRQSPNIYNLEYISNAILFWQELLDLIPEEMELYMAESRKRVRRSQRSRKQIPVLSAADNKVKVVRPEY